MALPALVLVHGGGLAADSWERPCGVAMDCRPLWPFAVVLPR